MSKVKTVLESAEKTGQDTLANGHFGHFYTCSGGLGGTSRRAALRATLFKVLLHLVYHCLHA